MSQFNKFVPLQKMEEQPDGTLHVYGLVTAEEPDLEKEVCDYETTKAQYQEVTAEQLQKTSLPGMTPSLMPLREMHQSIVQGAGRTVDYYDATKAIRMGFHVVDPTAVKKWKAGCFVGFSQGGSYIKTWDDPEFPGCRRYTARPMEISAVDAPCLPSALVESMKGRTVTLAKVDGATEEVALQTDASRLDRIERSVEELADLLKREFSTSQREHAASTGAALPDGSFPIENEQDLKNAIHAYGRAKDKAKAKEHIISRAKSLGLTHLLPEDWSGSEKAADGGKGAAMKITTQQDLTKAAKTIHDHLEKLHEMHKALGEHLDKAHESQMNKHEALGNHIEKCMKAAKDAAEGEEPEAPEKVTPSTDFKKALDEALAGLTKSFNEKLEAVEKSNKELTEKLSKTPAVTPPSTGAGGGERTDMSAEEAELFKGLSVNKAA